MAANNALLLTDINFDEIKDNLKNFLSNQTELGDYDYESSTMQILLNLLAYNTYMNSYYLNAVSNEMYLDSAQVRNNVVSRAKMLGYTPRSAHGSTATVQVVINPNDAPDTITIPENTQFRATVDGTQYVFVNPDAKVVNADSSGVFSTNIDITEGRIQTFRWTVSSENPVRYIIPNDNVDTRSLKVQVQTSASDTTTRTYTLADNLTNVTSTSEVYFLSENINGRYEITFGDNILGKQLNDGNIIILTYRICNGSDSLSASTFTAVSSISGYTDITLNIVSAAQGGQEKESMQSIKYNAPKFYSSQNRAVTKKDYETLIKNNFADLQAVSVWGGEDNSPPVYGKVYISVKPRSGNLLANDRKDDIVNFLIQKNVLSIEPNIVDPTFVYVKPEIEIRYNPKMTTQSPGAFLNGLKQVIINYENNNLGVFGQQYKTSSLASLLNAYSEAVDNVSIDINLKKKIVPNTSVATTYRIPFNEQVHTYEGVTKPYNISSSKFTFANRTNCYFDDDGLGNIRIYYLSGTSTRNYILNNAGTVDYNTGLIVLNNLLITDYDGDYLELVIDPEEYFVTPVRNQILLIDDAKIDLYDIDLGAITATASNITTQGQTNVIRESGVLTTVY